MASRDGMSYDLKSYGRGIAYIFVNKNYEKANDYEDRKGADEEYKALTRMFKNLSFKVRSFKNEGIIEKLQDACSHPTLEDRSCFVCVICSHGIEKEVEKVQQHFIVDGKGNEINTNDIVSIVCDSKALRKKPKLFFIQACRENDKSKRAEKHDFGVLMKSVPQQPVPVGNKDETDGSSKMDVATQKEDNVDVSDSDTDTDDGLSDREEFDLTNYYNDRRLKIQQRHPEKTVLYHKQKEHVGSDDSDDNKCEDTERPITETDSIFKLKKKHRVDKPPNKEPGTVISIPCYEDMLIMFASTPGKYAFRNDQTGGFLVRSLCDVINGYLKEDDGKYLENTCFLSILTKVVNLQSKRKVSIDPLPGVPSDVTTVPVIYHRLTKDIHIPIMKPQSWKHKLKTVMKHH
ncbi:uncharacterized protein LOC132555734 [Ylistrum balloti]|uniref:uncharacterized protein LOC132555734 n=1 Tax=Ylistrum balloti TaxID=509963 RepID=UPI002905D97C|nr:uncharacterized protein LOC132555734 [Ylistrum balloti]